MTSHKIEKQPSPATDMVTRDVVSIPADVTEARLGLGRAGSSLPTRAVLDFVLDHARARDAVHALTDFDALQRGCATLGLEQILVESACADRQTYLRRPDLGRRLSEHSRAALSERMSEIRDVVIVVADGLSSKAIHEGAAVLLSHLLPRLQSLRLSLGPLIFAKQARVAIADEIGKLCKARLSIVLVGERPGLSAANSLGAYMTFAPEPGRTDAERNCVSNIRPGGLDYELAAFKLAWLTDNALRARMSGVRLKDDSEVALHATNRISKGV